MYGGLCAQQPSFIGLNTYTVTLVSGQSELGAQRPARGKGGPSAPNGPNGPLRGSESAKVGDPIPRVQAQEAPQARRILRLAVRQGVLRLSPIESRGEG
eukprot:15430716-Alexandrium_andersonii.AAC.1